MNKTQLILGSYNHLPPGTAETTLETTYQRSYRPFLSVLYRFPELQATIHYSGFLLTWLEARHPEFLMLLAEMAGRKQVEILGGAYFEPILPLMPSADRIGQIEALTVFIRRRFGRRPRGCWLAEYAWEPGLAGALKTSGMDYAFLLERSFRLAGMAGQALEAPVATEDQGRDIAIYPANDCFASFEQPLGFDEALLSLRERAPALAFAALLLPGEGAEELWLRSGLESPDVYFERVFSNLSRQAPALETILPARHLRSRKHLERAYFPNSAGDRFLDAGAPPALLLELDGLRKRLGNAASNLPRPGSIRQTILRTEEAAALYAKMQYVHLLVSQLRGDKSRKKTAQEELWSGQAGEAYWSAPSGGIASASVRGAAYASLIEAEKITRQKGTFSAGIIQADIDYDREKEILFQGLSYNAYIHAKGGVLFELDHLRSGRNLASGYSGERKGSGGLRRRCFVDALGLKPAQASELASGRIEDSGGFGEAWYEAIEVQRPNHEVGFRHETLLSGRPERPLALEKRYLFRRNQLLVRIQLSNKGADPLECHYLSLLHLSPSWKPGEYELQAACRDGDGVERERPLERGAAVEAPDCLRVMISDSVLEDPLAISADKAFRLLSAPYSNEPGESGLAAWQGHALGLEWTLSIPPGGDWKTTISLAFRDEKANESPQR